MWVDIERKMVFEYNWNNKQMYYWQLEKRVSLLLPSCDDNKLILGMQGGLANFDLSENRFQWLLDIEKEIDINRCNDGACDAYGRLWVGTMSIHLDKGAGSLYVLDEDFSLQKKIEEVSIPNGIVWSLDNKRMYFIDSIRQCVQSYLFDIKTGDLIYEKTAIQIPESLGTPDGMTIDEEGMLWIAHYGGFGVFRWNPVTGDLIEKISLPVPNVTSCIFGGKNLDILFVTTARQELSEDDLLKYPESGNLFCSKTKVKGFQTSTFKIENTLKTKGDPVFYPKFTASNGLTLKNNRGKIC